MRPNVVLSARELGINQAEYRALDEIRELFARNTFVHDKDVDADKPDGFNMNVPAYESECGTTCCIGGWMFKAMKRDHTTLSISAGMYVNKDRSRSLVPLFFPFILSTFKALTDSNGDEYDFPNEEITPGMALMAIDNFRTTGSPNWPKVCGFEPSHA